MLKACYFLLIFTFIIPGMAMSQDLAQINEEAESPLPVVQDETCDEKLQAHLQELLEKDHNGILSLHYQLTMLKLAKKTVGGKHKTLEEFIKRDLQKLNQLNRQDPITLTKLNALYNGQASEHVKSVYQNINSLKAQSAGLDFLQSRKIENDDVASYILYESMQNQDSGFTKTDIAITWMMKNLKARAQSTASRAKASAAEMSNAVARYTGIIKNVDASSTSEIQRELNTVKSKIDRFMIDAKKAVMAANPECNKNGGWAGECTELQLNSEVSSLMIGMNNVSSQVARSVVDGIARQTRGARNVAIGRERTNSCGGVPFEPAEKSFHRLTLSTPDAGKADKAIEAFNKGPMDMVFGPVRCGKKGHRAHKRPVFQIDTAHLETCCQNRITPYVEKKVLIALEWDLECRGFYGIPYVAEVGIKGGVQIEAGAGGKTTLEESTCRTKDCIYGKGVFRPYLAVYAEVLAGAAALEGGIQWEPTLSVGYCRVAGDNWKFKGELAVNSIYLYYQTSAAWGLVSSFNSRNIYTSKTKINFPSH